ncbi:MAG: DUF2188 domain-containing protein [Planctomycetota bacterium]
MAKRVTYWVTSIGNGDWKVKKEGASKSAGIYNDKSDAVDKAKDLAKSNTLGQVIIKKQDGKIQTEYTYGKDPYPPKG